MSPQVHAPARKQSSRKGWELRSRVRRLRELESLRADELARIRPGGGDVFAVLRRVEEIEAEIDAVLDDHRSVAA